MHLSSVTISGFRGIDTCVEFAEPMSVLIGPNNSGKSATIDALRAVLQPHVGQQGKYWLSESDFTRAAGSEPRADEIRISVEIAGIKKAERGRMISLLAPGLGKNMARLTLRAKLDSAGRVVSRFYGGDLDHSEVEGLAKESVRFVYLPPLRDAAGDLRPGNANRLADLVSAHAPEGHADRDQLISIMDQTNLDLAAVDAIVKASDAIKGRLSGITGSGPYSHQAELKFADARYERIVRALQALGGATSAAALAENGLGYNNLIYMSVLLAALESDETPLSVLLIEEPEAHLHPQLQTRLMEYFESLTVGHAQIVATTHSAQFASSSRVDRVTALFRDTPAGGEAHRLSRARLSGKEAKHLERFLDVTKSALLFAEAGILVEGIGEQLVMSALATRLGISLSEFGVSVICVDGLAFAPFVKLFATRALNLQCSLVTDSDPYFTDDGTWVQRSATAQKLAKFEGANVKVEFSEKTFEWDLALANWSDREIVDSAIRDIRPTVGRRIANTDYESAEKYADGVLKAVKKWKGEFGLALATRLESDPAQKFTVPGYLERSIRWVTTGLDDTAVDESADY